MWWKGRERDFTDYDARQSQCSTENAFLNFENCVGKRGGVTAPGFKNTARSVLKVGLYCRLYSALFAWEGEGVTAPGFETTASISKFRELGGVTARGF
jgi:hypothetical protein